MSAPNPEPTPTRMTSPPPASGAAVNHDSERGYAPDDPEFNMAWAEIERNRNETRRARDGDDDEVSDFDVEGWIPARRGRSGRRSGGGGMVNGYREREGEGHEGEEDRSRSPVCDEDGDAASEAPWRGEAEGLRPGYNLDHTHNGTRGFVASRGEDVIRSLSFFFADRDGDCAHQLQLLLQMEVEVEDYPRSLLHVVEDLKRELERDLMWEIMFGDSGGQPKELKLLELLRDLFEVFGG